MGDISKDSGEESPDFKAVAAGRLETAETVSEGVLLGTAVEICGAEPAGA